MLSAAVMTDTLRVNKLGSTHKLKNFAPKGVNSFLFSVGLISEGRYHIFFGL